MRKPLAPMASPDSPHSPNPAFNPLNIGIDIGGTFTDFVVFNSQNGELTSFKVLSTPGDPAQAVIEGLKTILGPKLTGPMPQIVHGSTVATNALLERKGAATALITTRGFKDVLHIGRQNRPALYDFFTDPAPPLAPEHLRWEVDERVASTGEALQTLDIEAIRGLPAELKAKGVQSAAVCLLFSFIYPEHEQTLGRLLHDAGLSVSLSSDVLPEYREYERASTTTVNAYVSPILEGYLSSLTNSLDPKEAGLKLRVMQSNGGQISPAEARRYGVRCILSGPAGGIVGAMSLANMLGGQTITDLPPLCDPSRIITFDMGGTSTDVSLIDKEPRLTTESVVGGCPISVPVLDIHTIGAGGGSIALIDAGGALRVGPQSAGADPGPACYGRGELPTVTDANLVLGRISPEHFLGGEMPLAPERAERALSGLGERFGLDPVSIALGVIEVANAHMERALRLISVERGRDPGLQSGAPFTLLSFGGAGGLHAVELARRLDIPYVLAPPLAATLSAFGMLAADVVKDYTHTVMLGGDVPPQAIGAALDPLVRRGYQDLAQEGFSAGQTHVERFLDLRYKGQSYELTVPWDGHEDLRPKFHAAHRLAYGYANPFAEIEIVNVRLRASGATQSPRLTPQPVGDPDPSVALASRRPVVLEDKQTIEAPFYRYESLRPGHRLAGPAVVLRSDTTIWLPPGSRAVLDEFQNILIETH
jgi:N-methylhydantoinase A